MEFIVLRPIIGVNNRARSSNQSLCDIGGMVECSWLSCMTAQQISTSTVQPAEPVPKERHESGRRYGIRDGLFQAVAQGGGEQYLSAFALLLHATPFQLSILSAMPQLLGTWAQLVSVKISHWFPSQASQVFWGTIGQSVSWLPILALPLLWPDRGPWLLIAAVAVYYIFAHFTAPAWNSLITDLLEPNERGMYFAKRARAIALTSFITLCLAGVLLSFLDQQHLLRVGFAAMFLIAARCRRS